MMYLILFPLWSIPVMFLWYAIGIQYNRGGWWKLLYPIAFAGFLFDVFLQYTVANIWFWEINPRNEATISMRTARLLKDKGWRGVVAHHLAVILNWLAPDKNHIKR